ncbi:hypothetical protein PR001_g10462 [Phytophthora rubi]|uniref:RxLR effector protein n=1 Tax=Phytophthora rubi TaxID=129364 RepID=A0A6A3MBM9_9STRA|nr:hypothetical protein PR002_g10489 [Phytophthora rubi]KAE9032761.1 hypothetical protein PR001_g10462 [Phytophthora rubi]
MCRKIWRYLSLSALMYALEMSACPAGTPQLRANTRTTCTVHSYMTDANVRR